MYEIRNHWDEVQEVCSNLIQVRAWMDNIWREIYNDWLDDGLEDFKAEEEANATIEDGYKVYQLKKVNWRIGEAKLEDYL